MSRLYQGHLKTLYSTAIAEFRLRTASVLLGVYSPYTPSSSVLGSLEILRFRYETEFLDDLIIFFRSILPCLRLRLVG